MPPSSPHHTPAPAPTPAAADPGRGRPGPSLLPALRPPDEETREALRQVNDEDRDMGWVGWMVLDVVLTVMVLFVVVMLVAGC